MTCNRHAPGWERTYQQWKDKGVAFVGIGLLDSREASEGFVKRHKLTFPNGYDADGKIARAYGFTSQPYWAVIAKDGTLVRAGYGPSSEEELLAAVRAVSGR